MKQAAFDRLEEYRDCFALTDGIETHLICGVPEQCAEPKISFLLPTYNRPGLLRESLESIANQEQVDFNWETVIIDNSENENVRIQNLACVRSFENPRFLYFQNRNNLGHEGSLNRGVTLCRATWVALVHDDDLVVRDYLRLASEYIRLFENRKIPVGYLRAKFQMFQNTNELIEKAHEEIDLDLIEKETVFRCLMRGCGPTFINSCGTLIRREAFLASGGYDPDTEPIADAVLGLRVWGSWQVLASDCILGYYRWSEGDRPKEQMIKLVEADYLIREYLYKKNTLTRIFGALFRGVQFHQAVEHRIHESANIGIKLIKSQFEYICPLRRGRLCAGLLWVIRLTYRLFVPPSVIRKKIKKKISQRKGKSK